MSRSGDVALRAGLAALLVACSPGPSAAPSEVATGGVGSQPTVVATGEAHETPPSGPAVAPTTAVTPVTGPVPTTPSGTYRAIAVSQAPAIAMRVAVAELNVRFAPSTAGEKVYLARRGDIVLAHDWPVIASGYTWYFGWLPGLNELPTLPEIFPPAIDPPQGWTAASSESGTYMVALPPRCPTVVNLPNVAAMLESERLACFGSRSLEFEGRLGCGYCEGIAGIGTPGWLANDHTYSVLVADEDHGLPLFFPTGVPAEDELGRLAVVRGHFDDPAAAMCSIGLQDNAGQFELDPGIAQEFCRQRFVVDEVELT